MWWLRNSIICSELVETEKPRIEVSPSLFARDCMYRLRCGLRTEYLVVNKS